MIFPCLNSVLIYKNCPLEYHLNALNLFFLGNVLLKSCPCIHIFFFPSGHDPPGQGYFHRAIVSLFHIFSCVKLSNSSLPVYFLDLRIRQTSSVRKKMA